MIDIIIPVLNEEKILREKQEYYKILQSKAYIVFVDGGSSDKTVEIAQNYGDVVLSQRGRGIQKNSGVKKTRAQHILFLHVDSYVDEEVFNQIPQALNNGVVGGCFTMKIEDQRPIFRVYEKAVNFRAKVFGIIDGDLGMFVQRKAFEEAGCFDHLPVMEDLLFAKKLRKIGKIAALSHPIFVSSRKWDECGFLRTFLKYSWAYIQLWGGLIKENGYRRSDR